MRGKNSVILRLIFLAVLFMMCCSENYNETKCDRRPLGTKTPPLPPDNRFALEILGVNDKYIPNKTYKVRLFAKDNSSTFIAFSISAREDTKPNDKNPGKQILLNAGTVLPSPENMDTMPHPDCKNTVIQNNVTPKHSVEAIWIAPPKENQCVTIYAVLAVKRDMWYRYDGPLSKFVCEDRRKADDMPPQENDNCQVCEEARYQVTFEGLWSYNTHPQMYPQASTARFSDVVGASHSPNYNIYKENSDASLGLKMLAEQGNTTRLEMKIQEELGGHVRTVIKATGQAKSSMSTVAMFRTTPYHHVVSLVAALIPSPDWFVGVSSLELCEYGTDQWARNCTLNLYPMDAGTDSGKYFESPNEETSPPRPIAPAIITNSIDKEQIKPFARVRFELMQTYLIPDCTIMQVTPSDRDGEENTEGVVEVTSESGSTEDTGSSPSSEKIPNCPVTTEWSEWWTCEGIESDCTNEEKRTKKGMRSRFRYFIVDGKPLDTEIQTEVKIPSYCYEHADLYNEETCDAPCDE